MQVSCKGFIGELVKLKRYMDENYFDMFLDKYKISIYNTEKKATITFDGIKLSDVKFQSGEVSFE